TITAVHPSSPATRRHTAGSQPSSESIAARTCGDEEAWARNARAVARSCSCSSSRAKFMRGSGPVDLLRRLRAAQDLADGRADVGVVPARAAVDLGARVPALGHGDLAARDL